jgi:hypothetical protein
LAIVIGVFSHHFTAISRYRFLFIYVGGRPKAKVEKHGVFGKESMHEQSDSWKREQHMCACKGKQQLEGRTTCTHGRKT